LQSRPPEAESATTEKTSTASDPVHHGSSQIAETERQQSGDEPSDAELERGILDAVRAGLADVARVLSGQLEARQRSRAGNVVTFDPKRRTR
jgi:hypothetical protein